jgi:hypothetical protein
METIFEKLGGRKFVLALVVIVVGTLVQMFGKNGLSTEFVGLLVGITGIFGAANAAVSMKHADQTAMHTHEGPGVLVGELDLAASTGDEANVKADQLAEEITQFKKYTDDYLLGLGGDMQQLRSELQTQAESLALATKLIKANMRINV